MIARLQVKIKTPWYAKDRDQGVYYCKYSNFLKGRSCNSSVGLR